MSSWRAASNAVLASARRRRKERGVAFVGVEITWQGRRAILKYQRAIGVFELLREDRPRSAVFQAGMVVRIFREASSQAAQVRIIEHMVSDQSLGLVQAELLVVGAQRGVRP